MPALQHCNCQGAWLLRPHALQVRVHLLLQVWPREDWSIRPQPRMPVHEWSSMEA